MVIPSELSDQVWLDKPLQKCRVFYVGQLPTPLSYEHIVGDCFIVV